MFLTEGNSFSSESCYQYFNTVACRCYVKIARHEVFALKTSLLMNASTGFTSAESESTKENDDFPNKKQKRGKPSTEMRNIQHNDTCLSVGISSRISYTNTFFI